MEQNCNEISWVPLESNPDVLNNYMRKLQIETALEFQDVFGLDPDLLAMVPSPVAGIVLLFPISQQTEDYRKLKLETTKNQIVSDKLFFMHQTIGNACGTVGLYHCLANTELVSCVKGPFKDFLDRCKGKSPAEKANILETSNELASIHKAEAESGQTAAPDSQEDVDLHFIAFVIVDGCLYELDGRCPVPINLGPSDNLLNDSAKEIKKIMELNPEELNFTVMALAAPSEY